MKQRTLPKSKGFNNTITQAQSHMSKPQVIFSKLIHFRMVEVASELLTKILFRPIPLMLGGFCAAVVPLLIWVFAKYYGYGMSGSETAISFLAGWIVGYFIEYVLLLISGRSFNRS